MILMPTVGRGEIPLGSVGCDARLLCPAPEGIVWPENDDGLPSFKLEHLTKANGVEHLQAHDAMSDVYATIAMAKLVKQAQPVCLIICISTAVSIRSMR